MRIVVAGGTRTSRALLTRGLEQEPSWRVVGEADDALSGFRCARECGADALVLDRIPGDPADVLTGLPVDTAPFAVVMLVDVPGRYGSVPAVSVTRGVSMSHLRSVISNAVCGASPPRSTSEERTGD